VETLGGSGCLIENRLLLFEENEQLVQDFLFGHRLNIRTIEDGGREALVAFIPLKISRLLEFVDMKQKPVKLIVLTTTPRSSPLILGKYYHNGQHNSYPPTTPTQKRLKTYWGPPSRHRVPPIDCRESILPTPDRTPICNVRKCFVPASIQPRVQETQWRLTSCDQGIVHESNDCCGSSSRGTGSI
jgi:hypothetical protein